ncbi:MAG: ExeM/NucH family extracellular endonuclease, partial [Actinomycetota bacterium]|nr:ExeM/NucH family extracellular endonuclease [Actinomycetota bacterium]
CPTANVVDLVGYGSATNCSETAPTANLSNTTAALRSGNGATDTDSNVADFTIGAPNPRNSGFTPPPPPPPSELGNCGDPATRIHAIQGSGATAAQTGVRTIEGVVVGDYQGAGQFNGYFVQEEVADQDTNSLTSEGIFVFSGSGVDNVDTGDIVRVRGTAGEFGGMTQISSVTGLLECGVGASVPATSVSLPVSNVADHESFEGMLVRYSQILTATEVFSLGRFGEVSLSGAGRLYIPTAVTSPGAPALAVAAQNARSRIILDDASNTQNLDPTRYPQGGLSATNTLRVGDTLSSLTGILDFRFSNYRIQPVGAVSFANTNLRPTAPTAVGGNLKVASFNVLNYFNGNGTGQEGAAGGFPTARGATTQFEFDRQEAKIVSALTAIDADIVGLMEIENDGGANNALAELVGALNAATAPGTYAFVDTGVIGTDAIKVAVIFKPAVVAPVGEWKILTTADDPRFLDTRNRPTLAQTFRHTSSGQVLTVAVNHLKSKGSRCGAGDDATDGSGNCNGTRTLAAAALADWLQTDPTGSGDPDVLIIGDLNSYTFETPITTLEAEGFTNLVRQFQGLDAYSYVFNGESGYLDHALATGSLVPQVSGVTEWHINPDEPTVLDYNVEFKTPNQVNTYYDPGPYRASDHDPIIIGLQLNHAPVADAGGPYSVAEGASVTVSATGSDADGDTLSYAWDLDNDGEFDDATGQSVSFSAAAIDGPATRTIRVRVSDAGSSTVDEATVSVTNVAPTATFNAPATTLAGSAFTLSLTDADDAAPADEPGLQYAFDCGSGYGAFSAVNTAVCPTDSTGTRNVGGKVRDDDGGETEYRATVTVSVTFASLCALVQQYVDKEGVAKALCSKLDAAARKADRKDQEADLHAFVNQVEAQSGKSMTAAEAATLIRLAAGL